MGLPQERPRERLFELGRRCLADNELLALVLGSGVRGLSAEGLAQRLLDHFGGLAGVAGATTEQLRAMFGIGQARSARVAACLELGQRMLKSKSKEKERISSAKDVWELCWPKLAFEQRERFLVILLGGRNDVLAVRTVAEGTRASCVVQAREFFRQALVEGACGVILVHNHPSGDPSPSEEDKILTRKAAEGGQFIGIPIIDHVIVAASGYRSMREEGYLA